MARASEPNAAVAATLARLAETDPFAATDAGEALTWLLSDQGFEALTRYGMQQFIWYELPFKWVVSPVVRRDVVAALARALDLAGLARYAALCRSETTAAVLDAWARDPTEGYAAYRRATAGSGVEPPDTPELVWRAVMGTEESGAFWSTSVALEMAIEGGELHPGAPGWRARQVEIAQRHLAQEREDLLGESLLDAVATARLASWIEGTPGVPSSAARRQVLAPVANALLHPVDPPRDVVRSMAPATWLLQTTGERGITLTEKGNLPRSLVRRAVERFPAWWRDPSGAEPRREADVPALATVHGELRRIRALRRQGRRLELTALGRSSAEDPRALWRAVAEAAATGPDLVAAAHETVFAILLGEAYVPEAELEAELSVVLTEAGWYHGFTGEPVPRAVVTAALDELRHRGTALGWLRIRRRGQPGWRLTDAGRATARAALRARALAGDRRRRPDVA